ASGSRSTASAARCATAPSRRMSGTGSEAHAASRVAASARENVRKKGVGTRILARTLRILLLRRLLGAQACAAGLDAAADGFGLAGRRGGFGAFAGALGAGGVLPRRLLLRGGRGLRRLLRPGLPRRRRRRQPLLRG